MDLTIRPFGRADMLEVAFVTARAAHVSLLEELETVARGGRADLAVLDGPTAAEALRRHGPRRLVVREARSCSSPGRIRGWCVRKHIATRRAR